MAYAEHTTVPVAKTRAEIEALLAKHKCTQFVIGSDSEDRRALVQFKAENRIVKFIIGLPDPADKKFTQDPRSTWRRRSQSAIDHAVAQAERQRWRALMLVIKAKLEAVASGITEFEQEFLAHIVMPDGRTVADHARPAIQQAYETGKMPTTLLQLTAGGGQ